jgi:hypothetical protein
MNPSLTNAGGQPTALGGAAMKAWLGLLIALATSFFPLLAQTAEKPKRNLLSIGQAKGYQHEAISTAMATLYNLGRSSGQWNTVLRTDCTAITKKPLKWEAKNLNAFDAIVFFTDGDLDMDAAQKADLLSFVRDDGKGFIGIHSAAITFTSWPEYGQCSAAISMVTRGDNSTRRSSWKIQSSLEWRISQRRSPSSTRFIRSRISPGRTFACCSASTPTKSISPARA